MIFKDKNAEREDEKNKVERSYFAVSENEGIVIGVCFCDERTKK
jgi:hypothetical protein